MVKIIIHNILYQFSQNITYNSLTITIIVTFLSQTVVIMRVLFNQQRIE